MGHAVGHACVGQCKPLSSNTATLAITVVWKAVYQAEWKQHCLQHCASIQRAQPDGILGVSASLYIVLQVLSKAANCANVNGCDTLVLLMPGGADLPYCKALNGPGKPAHCRLFATERQYHPAKFTGWCGCSTPKTFRQCELAEFMTAVACQMHNSHCVLVLQVHTQQHVLCAAASRLYGCVPWQKTCGHMARTGGLRYAATGCCSSAMDYGQASRSPCLQIRQVPSSIAARQSSTDSVGLTVAPTS
jgi:hypothetical protein